MHFFNYNCISSIPTAITTIPIHVKNLITIDFNYLHPLQSENCDSNPWLEVGEDGTPSIMLKTAQLQLCTIKIDPNPSIRAVNIF